MTAPDRNARLAAIAERHAKTTPGEWIVTRRGKGEIAHSAENLTTKRPAGYAALVWATTDDDPQEPYKDVTFRTPEADENFIAHSHQDTPWLLAYIARLESSLTQARELMATAASTLEIRARKHWLDISPRAEPSLPPFCGECMTDVPNHKPDCLVTKLRTAADEADPIAKQEGK